MARLGRPPKASDLSERGRMHGLDKSTNEEFIVDMLNYFWEEASTASVFTEFAKSYERNWLFYHGHQWLDDDLADLSSDDRSYINRDLCFQEIRRIVPLLTDARPVRYVRADRPNMLVEEVHLRQQLGMVGGDEIKSDEDIADDMTGIWRAMEERNREEM